MYQKFSQKKTTILVICRLAPNSRKHLKAAESDTETSPTQRLIVFTDIKENSGKIYRFKLGHDLGYGFAEVYYFTDQLSTMEGCIIYVYDRIDREVKPTYSLSHFREAVVALGPIRSYKFPNTRGLHSWEFLFKTDELLIHELTVTKELQGNLWEADNWKEHKTWSKSDRKPTELLRYMNYEDVRELETRVINGPSGVVIKFTMKVILDHKEKVSQYYDLSDLANRNLFVQLVNTYYPSAKTKVFLKQLPAAVNTTGEQKFRTGKQMRKKTLKQ